MSHTSSSGAQSAAAHCSLFSSYMNHSAVVRLCAHLYLDAHCAHVHTVSCLTSVAAALPASLCFGCCRLVEHIRYKISLKGQDSEQG